MTTKRKLKIFIVVLTLLFFGITSNYLAISSIAYTPHVPIFIHSNSEFHSIATANSWTGDGLTAETAYIIESYSITNDNFELIVIEDTNVYFEISHCYFDNVKSGSYDLDAIYLKNVQNGIISNNTIVNSRHGIFIDYGCSNLVIGENFIDATSESGLRINYSDSIEVYRNNITNSVHHAIWIHQTSNCVIDNNNLTKSYNGIWIREGSTTNNITNNKISDTTNGIWISNYSNYNDVYFNLLNSTHYGIVIADQTTGTELINNTIYNCPDYGISLDGTTSLNNITGNSFIENNLGGTSQCIDNGTANLIDYNYWDEWTTPDIDTNGIVDNPYSIDGTSINSDPHPLTTQNQYVQHILTGATFLFPLGGEYLNNTVEIQWTPAYDTFDHDIYYNVSFRQDLGPWTPIGVEINETGVNWITSPSLDGIGYQIRIISYCTEGIETISLSGIFSIRHHYLSPLSLISSLGGTIVNNVVTIQWTSVVDGFSDHFVLYNVYYKHNLSSWIPIAEGISETSLDWDTTLTHSGSGYQIRLVAYCNHGLVQEITTGYFSIENEPAPAFPWLYIIAGVASVSIIGLSISLGVVSNKLKKRSGKDLKPTPNPEKTSKPKAESKSELKSTLKSDSKPKSASKPESKPKSASKPESKPKSDLNNESKSEPDSKQES